MTDTTDQGVDLAQFVGEAPAGDSSPGDFMSNDQSVEQASGAVGGLHAQRGGRGRSESEGRS